MYFLEANLEHISLNFPIPTGVRMDPHRQGSNSIIPNSVSWKNLYSKWMFMVTVPIFINIFSILP